MASETQSTATLVFLAVGVWVSFTIYGWAVEALTSTEFGEEKERFRFEFTIIVMTAFSNAFIAFVVLKWRKEAALTGGAPYREWMFAAFAYLGSHMLNYMSLRYIIFPLQVLVKSCKAIPVMFGEAIFDKVQITAAKIISVSMLCLGLVVFTLGKGMKAEKVELDTKMMIGLCVVFCALLCDGIYGPYQNKIKSKAQEQGFKVTGYHNMFNMNLWQGVFATFFVLATGELPKVLAFIQRHPAVLVKLVNLGIAMSFGQVFIFQMQAGFGALTVTKTTTVRKLISVVFSVWYFGHSLRPLQWLGVGMVFLSEPAGKLLGGRKKEGASVAALSSSSGVSQPQSSQAGGQVSGDIEAVLLKR